MAISNKLGEMSSEGRIWIKGCTLGTEICVDNGDHLQGWGRQVQVVGRKLYNRHYDGC